MNKQFLVIERVSYPHRQDFGMKLLAVRDSINEAKDLIQRLQQAYKQNEHNHISFIYMEVDHDLLNQRLGNIQ